MDYDVVVATRNRQFVLKISLPLMLSQSRLPKRFIVVDSSDNHGEVCNIVNQATAGKAVELKILESEPGSSLQRNVGLQHVQSPVVIFPDDDSLWFPDSVERLMRIYEKDVTEQIGCVAFAATQIHPPATFASKVPTYKMELRDRLAARLNRWMGWAEEKILPDPIHPGGMWSHVWGSRQAPDWLKEEEAELCGPVFGYRMSFRTSVIRSIGGFDEHLGRYAMFEDSDATLGALRRSLNVVATRARVNHYRVPGERLSGWAFGKMAILNRAYVICKHSSHDATARRLLRRYLRYKILRYLGQSYSAYGRERLRGAIDGMSRLNTILEAAPEKLTISYLSTWNSSIPDFDSQSGVS